MIKTSGAPIYVSYSIFVVNLDFLVTCPFLFVSNSVSLFNYFDQCVASIASVKPRRHLQIKIKYLYLH